jgi:DNA polymerase III sliding clamp (beta) subunit (PCNA family)
MLIITLKRDQLAAAASHAAMKDIRYYLNGVLIEVNSQGIGYIVATDGRRAFIGNIGAQTAAPLQVIVPNDTIKLALAMKSPILTISQAAAQWSINGLNFTPCAGKFPDYRRIIPASHTEFERADFNWRYIADAEKALNIWTNNKNGNARLHIKDAVSVVTCIDESAFVVVMGLRPTRPAPLPLDTWFNPAQ